ncbi:ferredoxin [Aquamicrobium sp. LC103]|uniref:ferredoxin n=1 Tax=Aquamicrobium sp. LC103 TaxID=1120658 RepID=UPI000699D871|nr:ferredoxin [Aquamicrobium sp. LC103]
MSDEVAVLTVRVDRSICAGHALCAMRAPEVYELDAEGFCASDGRQVSAVLRQKAELGARICPEAAITLEEIG